MLLLSFTMPLYAKRNENTNPRTTPKNKAFAERFWWNLLVLVSESENSMSSKSKICSSQNDTNQSFDCQSSIKASQMTRHPWCDGSLIINRLTMFSRGVFIKHCSHSWNRIWKWEFWELRRGGEKLWAKRGALLIKSSLFCLLNYWVNGW